MTQVQAPVGLQQTLNRVKGGCRPSVSSGWVWLSRQHAGPGRTSVGWLEHTGKLTRLVPDAQGKACLAQGNCSCTTAGSVHACALLTK